jgi:excisionase family DNA binding protein
MSTHYSSDELLTPAEVAALLFVDPKTVTRWARAGKLDAIRTPGGHRRYRRTDVLAIMAGDYRTAAPAAVVIPAARTSSQVSVRSDEHGTGATEAAAVVAEATATSLEAEAELAAQAVVEAAAAVAAAAERAAVAAARARAARVVATETRLRTEKGARSVAQTSTPSEVQSVAVKAGGEVLVPSQREGTEPVVFTA